MSLAGSFLIAETNLDDPNFRRTVVLILAHNEGGAFGLIVNRPVKKTGLPFPVFHGGPCPAPGLFMLHGHPDWVDEEAEATTADFECVEEKDAEASEGDSDAFGDITQREVAPGIFLGDPASLQRASESSEGDGVRFRAFKGYAGWGPGQLENELDGGSWQVTPATSDLLFGTPVESLWRLLAPPRIPKPSLN